MISITGFLPRKLPTTHAAQLSSIALDSSSLHNPQHTIKIPLKQSEMRHLADATLKRNHLKLLRIRGVLLAQTLPSR